MPYGIVLEIKRNQFKNGKYNDVSAVVYWFKEDNPHAEKKRVNNARFLKVINSGMNPAPESCEISEDF